MVVSVLAACGGGGSTPADGPPPTEDAAFDARPDAAFDAMPDAAPAIPLPLEVDAGQGPITTWSFPATAPGQHAAITLIVRNRGAAPIEPLTASLGGPGPGDFAIVADGSTCGIRALAPGDPCLVRLTFAPTTSGPRATTLHLASGGGGFDLPLDGVAAVPTPGLIADAVSVDLGPIEVGQHGDATVQLTNTGATAVTLGARATSGDFAIVSDSCPASLATGGACTVIVRFTPSASGRAAASLDVGAEVHVALAGLGLRRVTIVLDGQGHGVVTSAPTGLDCGTACSALFFDDVTLTATPSDPAYAFTGWSDPSCPGDPICALAPGPAGSVTITARFDVVAPRIAITYAGTGRGYVLVVDSGAQLVLATCTDACTTTVFPGASITLYALTPSTFAGWGGACSGASTVCDLGAIDDNRAITATFDRDEREVATLLPGAAVTGLAMAPDGDVVIADATGVTKVSPAGAIAWTAPITGGARDLAIDAAGDVFGCNDAHLFALTPAGAPAWTRSFAVAHRPTMQSAVAASPDGTVIAALTVDGAHVVDAGGADRFTITGLTAEGVAVAPDGTVAIAIPSAAVPGGLSGVERYSVTGATLPPLDPLPGGYVVSIAYDGLGYLLAATTGSGGAAVSRFAPDLQNVFTHSESVGVPGNIPTALASDAAGDVVFLRQGAGMPIAGLQLEVFPPTGASTWTHAEPGAMEGLLPSALAGSRDQHFAVAGTYEGPLPSTHLPWIQIFANP